MKFLPYKVIAAIVVLLILCLIEGYTVSAFPDVQNKNSSTLNEIKTRGYLVVGVKYDSPPFGYINAEGELVGFEIDLAREFARRWLGDEQAIEFVQVISSNRIEKLLNRDVDLVAATMTYTRERDKQIDFSQTYYIDGQNILVRKDSGLRKGSDRESIQALDGKRIAAVKDSTSIRQIAKFTVTYGITPTIAEFEQYDQVIQPLLENKVDALSTDQGILVGLQKQHPELEILLDENISEERYGLGLPPKDSVFTAEVNDLLQEIYNDGTYNKIYRKWFSDQIPFVFESYIETVTNQETPITSAINTKMNTATPTPLLVSTATNTTLPTVISRATIEPQTVTSSLVLTALPTLTPVLTSLAPNFELTVTPTTTETTKPATSSPPMNFPPTGISMRSYTNVSAIIGLVVLLFAGAVYGKRIRPQ
jgi:putative glutamine transport system substrate-binding protein